MQTFFKIFFFKNIFLPQIHYQLWESNEPLQGESHVSAPYWWILKSTAT